jgi:predicted glycosyltransferase
MKMRQSIIRYTAESFQPDLLIVDKEPLGLRGELEETLSFLKTRATTLVLGLRDVMDAPRLLEAEWKQRDVMRKIDLFYDRIWVYGPSDFYDPLQGLDVSPTVRSRMSFVGFLPRQVATQDVMISRREDDYILVTPGGGGDGADLVHDVLDSYLCEPSLQHKALIVLGPYMPARKRRKLFRKAKKVPTVEMIEFDSHMENLIADAKGVVAMGGYNTFCEILSFDKPAIVVPRMTPREEQLIRARRAAELGLIEMLLPEQAGDAKLFAAALQVLPSRRRPSQALGDVPLEGLANISAQVGKWLSQKAPAHLKVVTEAGA